ncbi:MAG: hypothetical protein VX438_06565, partial [Planctomycetota bacterium]|nr:hypothetical protein [Planctomycetota bacterium]
GCSAMDELLPAKGYSRGTIVEWVADRGSGAGFLSLLAARNAAREGGGLVIVDSQGEFYPPAARALGLKMSHLIIVRSSEQGPCQSLSPHSSEPLDAGDFCWAIDQSLRSPAVAAVWGELPAFDSTHAERTWLRRFQISAETSGCIGFFTRTEKPVHSSWAEVQWKLRPQASSAAGRRIKATLVRCQGGMTGQSVNLEINMLTGSVQEHVSRSQPAHSLPLAAPLASSASRRRSARA